MNSTIQGILMSFGYVFAVILLTTLFQKKFQLSEEASRKTIHILVGNWIFFAVHFFTSPLWAAFVPFCFILVNYVSHKKQTFKAMERSSNDSLGTIWYAISLFLLTLIGFSLNKPYIALGGILAMAYGDGFAAVVGTRWGNTTYPAKFGTKSLEGTLTGFTLIFMVTTGVAYIYLPTVNSLLVGIIGGVIGMLLELLTPKGLDNLTLPLGVGLILFVFSLDSAPIGLIINITLTLSILFLAWLVDALTAKSCVAAFILGTALYCLSGWLIYTAMLAFAILGSGISKIGKERKTQAASLHEREGTRGSVQVAANGLPSLVFALLFFITKNEAFQVAALTSFAAANSDTFSSEIGMLSTKNPYSILTLKPLAKGLSGGVSSLGLISGLVGSILVGALALGSYSIQTVLLVIAGGFLGTLLDSLLGSAFQAKYRLNQAITERSVENGVELELASGYSFITNDMVNFFSVTASGLIIFLIVNG